MNRLNPLDNPEISTLPSGMQVATLHLPWSQTVDMSLTIKSGAYDDPPGKEGMAHLLEHLLFSRHKYERIENLGGEVGAFTTNIRISYELKCVAAQFSAIWAPFLLMRANPDFSSENCAHEKVIIDDERDVDRNKQLSLEIIRLSEAIACGYTGFKEPIIGSRESVDAITPADLQIFYNTHSVAANQILVAVGKLTHAEVCDLASEMGDHMPKGPLPQ
ncbi:MAG: M16 family metallopeptidase, partial [Dongiaceae bacterium]